MLSKGQFRVSVQVVANLDHGTLDFVQEFGEIISERVRHTGKELSTPESQKRCGLGWWASINAAVAQRIRASVYGTEGRGFESLQPHQCDLAGHRGRLNP
jgi:hypothetical protein